MSDACKALTYGGQFDFKGHRCGLPEYAPAHDPGLSSAPWWSKHPYDPIGDPDD